MFKHIQCKLIFNSFYLSLSSCKMLSNSGGRNNGSNQNVTIRRSTSAENLYQIEPGLSLWQESQTVAEMYCQNNAMNFQCLNYNDGTGFYNYHTLNNQVFQLPPFSIPNYQAALFYGGAPLTHTSISNVQCQTRNYMNRSNSADSVFKNHNVKSKALKVLSQRLWEETDKKQSAVPGIEFKLMSYNVLAQDLLEGHPYLYKYHNPNSLKWTNRWKNLVKEIMTILPDIMCLQEVQESHLLQYYTKFENLGYKWLFKKRTGIRTDGCAIFYQVEKFSLVEFETVEFFQPNIDILNRDNIAIIAKFSPKSHPGKEFIVATTHLLYNQKRQDVRLAQTQLLLTEVERLSFMPKTGRKDKYLPIIITGDFNSTPASVVYDFITEGVLKYNHLSARCLENSNKTCHGNVLIPSDLGLTDSSQHAVLVQKRSKNKFMSRKEEAALIKVHNSDKSVKKITTATVDNPELFCSGIISHVFAFRSVYQHGVTTFHDEWIPVDFIFYSGKKKDQEISDHRLELVSRYRLPRKSELGNTKIPNGLIGSDHISLVAKFKLRV